MKVCIACGMPMQKKEDFALGDESKDYCRFCCNEDGSMQSFEDKKKGLISFIIRTQGLDKDVAKNVATDMMKKLPAWEKYFD